MKEYSVKFYLGDMMHTYVLSAANEWDATQKVLDRIYYTSRDKFHGLEIKPYRQDWN